MICLHIYTHCKNEIICNVYIYADINKYTYTYTYVHTETSFSHSKFIQTFKHIVWFLVLCFSSWKLKPMESYSDLSGRRVVTPKWFTTKSFRVPILRQNARNLQVLGRNLSRYYPVISHFLRIPTIDGNQKSGDHPFIWLISNYLQGFLHPKWSIKQLV